MMRTLLIGIQIIGFLILSLGQKEEVKIEHNPPTNLNLGEEAIVSVEFDISDVKGFAKYQINVSEGLLIEAVEAEGASFTFNDGKGKFIWMSLPSNEEFKISYRLVSDGTTEGNMTIDSRFSYIYENERKNRDVPTHTVSVGNSEVLASNEEMETDIAKNNQQQNYVSAFRNIVPDGVNQWRVSVELSKNGVSGFAKIEETLPEGYTAIDLKSSGAIFNSMDQVIKYIWYDIPQNEKVTISYKLLPVMVLTGEEPSISGTFSYLSGEETMEIPILSSDEQPDELIADQLEEKNIPEAEVQDSTLADEAKAPDFENPTELVEKVNEEFDEKEELILAQKPDNEEEKEETVEEIAEVTETSEDEKAEIEHTTPQEKINQKAVNTLFEQEKSTEPVQASADIEEKLPVDANIVDVPNPETGVFYRVQIAAGKSNVKKQDFEKLYTFNEGYNLENHKGWFKYTTGYHQVYKAARDDRQRISSKYEKFQGPFVTAYNGGERISVQEALMVTAQKWYP